MIPAERIEHALFAAELSLEGELRSVRGVLSMTVGAKEHGFKEIFVAPGNGSEALLVDGIRVSLAIDSAADDAAGGVGGDEDLQHRGVLERRQRSRRDASVSQSASYDVDGGDDRRRQHPASGRGDALASRRAVSRRAA